MQTLPKSVHQQGNHNFESHSVWRQNPHSTWTSISRQRVHVFSCKRVHWISPWSRYLCNGKCKWKGYGSKLVEITTQQLRANRELEKKFNSLLSLKLALTEENFEIYKADLTSVYTELTRKLCNTRIQEFLDSHLQISVEVLLPLD